jgi:NitT/TauT family transport system ATP-binding protein
MTAPLRIGFIPLVDAAALIVAVDKGFTKAEGLDVSLVREVSWSNVRDKLNIGLFDAAHLLAPVAIASSLGLGHIKVPITAPFNLGLNGNAITVSPALHAELIGEIDGDRFDPMATANALARVVAKRRKAGAEPVTFGMTFPFSTHNYQLRFWMAAGGVDPDEDVRLVVLPPPYMVDSLASGQVDAFCVGAPWNSVAVDLGVGHILHGARGREGASGPAKLVGEKFGRTRSPDPRRVARGRIHRATGQSCGGRKDPFATGSHRRRCRGDPANTGRPAENLA